MSEEDFKVEAIVKSRFNERTKEFEYKVKWLNYPDDDNSWEKASELVGLADELIAEYHKSENSSSGKSGKSISTGKSTDKKRISIAPSGKSSSKPSAKTVNKTVSGKTTGKTANKTITKTTADKSSVKTSSESSTKSPPSSKVVESSSSSDKSGKKSLAKPSISKKLPKSSEPNSKSSNSKSISKPFSKGTNSKTLSSKKKTAKPTSAKVKLSFSPSQLDKSVFAKRSPSEISPPSVSSPPVLTSSQIAERNQKKSTVNVDPFFIKQTKSIFLSTPAPAIEKENKSEEKNDEKNEKAEKDAGKETNNNNTPAEKSKEKDEDDMDVSTDCELSDIEDMNVTVNVQSPVITCPDVPTTCGFEKGYKAELVKSSVKVGDKVLLLIKWSDREDPELVPSEIARYKIPSLVIDYYQKHILWKAKKKNSKKL